MTSKSVIPKHRVCLVYNERMTLHRYVPEPEEKEIRPTAWIPEHPDRITSIYKQLMDDELVERCLQLEPRSATRNELLWQHDPAYLDTMEATEKMNQSELARLEEQFSKDLISPINVFLCPNSQKAALLAAGSALRVVESILSGESRSGAAIIRPPGHHAEGDKGYGFCIYNNTAIAAKYALEVHGLERILIVDWDVHHGNGIQKMFLNDPRVLYVSLHSLDLFPWSIPDADAKTIGTGPGEGYNVNIGWPKIGMGDSEYLAAFYRIIMPISNQFDPQLVLVAAGFDSARGDPVGLCDVTPEGYAQMTHLLTSLAHGRVALLLEGGYNLESISKSMSKCVQALLGDPIPSPKVGPVDPGAAAAIVRANKYLRPYWSALKFHSQEEEFDAADELFSSFIPPILRQSGSNEPDGNAQKGPYWKMPSW